MAQVLRPCCISGAQTEGTPTGTVQKMAGVSTYVALPTPEKANGAAILISTDVFGYSFKNTQIIADAFAENGFIVVVPDQFNEKPAPPYIMETFREIMSPNVGMLSKIPKAAIIAYNAIPFLFFNPPLKKLPTLEAVISEVRGGKFGPAKKVGCIGYCYGGTACLTFGAKPDIVDAFAVAHTQIKVPDAITPLVKPGLFLTADNDHAFPKAKHDEAEKILKERGDGDKYEFVFYPGTFHGFAIRGDDKEAVIKEAKADAFIKALEFFKRTLL